ncbi:MAG: histidine phosphatase family protein [Candidatus Schmidhempelia sp.]|nr:histidine phosphatase family protein [Candidatus Schmidhempelia sp.]
MQFLFKAIVTITVVIISMSQVFASDVTLYVTRHGKTMFNTVHRAQGWSDTPLTKLGIEVAEQLGRGLKGIDFISVYSSDLGRARETARVVLAAKGDQNNIIEMPGLREICFGDFEGDLDPNMWNPAAKYLGYPSDKALMQAFGDKKIGLDKMINAIKAVEKSGQAESYATVRDRMFTSLQTIAKQAQTQGGGNVLVVSHGLAILTVINELVDQPLPPGLDNASITKIRYTDDDKFIVETINDTSYIAKGKLDH